MKNLRERRPNERNREENQYVNKGEKMVWICSPYFVDEWLKRAERSNEQVDDGDRFVSLWIAFNAWLKGKYGEDTIDHALIEEAKKNDDLKKVFNEMKANSQDFSIALKKIQGKPVADMRYINNSNRTKVYDGRYESLLDVLYQVRCNLFHGRKDPKENKRDFELISLAYQILLPLFKEYWQRHRS